MNERILKYLFDVKIAIDEIDSYFIDLDKRFDVYSVNKLLKRAIKPRYALGLRYESLKYKISET